MKRKKKYVYLVQVTRQLSVDIVNVFCREGEEVVLVTGSVECTYASLEPRIKVVSFTPYNNRSVSGRLRTGLLFHLQALFYLLFSGSRRQELILVTTPPFLVFLGPLFRLLRGQKYHLILWDLYPDVLIKFGVLGEHSLISRVWKSWNRSCFFRASAIFTLGEHLAVAVKKYSSKEPVIVPNWTDTAFIRPVNEGVNPFVRAHGLPGYLIVAYSGNLGVTHDLDTLLEAAALLKEEAGIRFVIIGDGARRKHIEAAVSERMLSNVLLLPRQEPAMLPFSLAAAHIGVISQGRGAEEVSVPSKTYPVLAAGSALLALASPGSEVGKLIGKYDCGRLFAHGQYGEVAGFIGSMAGDRKALNHYRENARRASLDFTPDNARIYYRRITSSQPENVYAT